MTKKLKWFKVRIDRKHSYAWVSILSTNVETAQKEAEKQAAGKNKAHFCWFHGVDRGPNAYELDERCLNGRPTEIKR